MSCSMSDGHDATQRHPADLCPVLREQAQAEQEPRQPSGAATYRRRSENVSAIVWDGTNDAAVTEFALRHSPRGPLIEPVVVFGHKNRRYMNLWVEKSNGYTYGHPIGTAVIAEPDGQGVYPCRSEQFAKSYRHVDDLETDGPPHGWYRFGTHAGWSPSPKLEFSEATDESDLPLFERPLGVHYEWDTDEPNDRHG